MQGNLGNLQSRVAIASPDRSPTDHLSSCCTTDAPHPTGGIQCGSLDSFKKLSNNCLSDNGTCGAQTACEWHWLPARVPRPPRHERHGRAEADPTRFAIFHRTRTDNFSRGRCLFYGLL